MKKIKLEHWKVEDIVSFISVCLEWPYEKCECDLIKQDMDDDRDVCMHCEANRILDFLSAEE